MIKQGNFPTAKAMAKTLEASLRTVYKDIAFMRERMNKPIEFDSKENGYYLSEPANFGGMWAGQPDLRELGLMGKALEMFPGHSYNGFLKAMYDEAVAALDDEQKQKLQEWKESFFCEPFGVDMVDPQAYDIMLTALWERRVVEYPYRKPDSDTFELRRVQPWAITEWRGGWYVVGFCEGAQDERTFHLSRLQNPKLLSRKYTIPKSFNARAHFKKCFGVQKGDGDYKVVARLERKMANIQRTRSWHSTQEFQDLPDGRALISFRLTSLAEVKYTILSWSKDATVIEPPELVQDIIGELKGALANYEDKNKK